MEYTVEFVSTMPELRDALSSETKDRSFKKANKPLKKKLEKQETVERKSEEHWIDILV
ncbi:hypothetical protein [Candidatus Magnetomonas plexicatena]|uniref:hypothetical protein n=1 Tax=Candidatus Magnetomonas plexicatena TaxID=2552947 RepID=UPI001C78659D|nr:hypothetical protein E2O03_007920 [Nitrospirales bacterium LBB_01]